MPFSLMNAPATFQSLVNLIFEEFLRIFVLVFFDDILIYSQSVGDHWRHLKLIFDRLRYQKLFVKQSKCHFGVAYVDYLSHIVSTRGVVADPGKIDGAAQWPIPKNIRELRGFLGLTGYYRKFVRNYGVIAQSLTQLLKKNAFQWGPEASKAFEELKSAMTSPHVLLLDFSKAFVLETDALGQAVGAVLMQDGHPMHF